MIAQRATKGKAPHKRTAGNVHRREYPARSPRAVIISFRKKVWDYWKKHGRHDLAWRKTKDPYKILVSEVMLQQTQVPRVIEKYKEFLSAFPDIHALARSNLVEVLKVWSGMGYNRRGKYLRDMAIEIVKKYGGKVPEDVVSLRSLPGIGPYTASAILIFAFNIPETMIETNVRSAFIYSFFPNSPVINRISRGPSSGKIKKGKVLANSDLPRTVLGEKGAGKISDRELLPLIVAASEGQDPRTWHWALMDYGSHLKKIHPNPSRASAHYARQSKFEGSLRQVRGAILRELHIRSSTLHRLPFPGERVDSAAKSLCREGLIKKTGKLWRIA